MRVEEELTEEELLALAEAEEKAETDEEEQEEDERVEEVLPAALRRYSSVAGAIGVIVAGRHVDLDALTDLTDEEREALEALQEVVRGRDGDRFMLAEDRLTSLNRTLAILQPALGVATHDTVMDELSQSFAAVIDNINHLRDHLEGLDVAEELMEQRADHARAAAADGDTDEKPDDKKDPAKKKPKPEEKVVPAYDPSAPDLPEAPRPGPSAYDPAAPELPPEPPPPPSVYEPEGGR